MILQAHEDGLRADSLIMAFETFTDLAGGKLMFTMESPSTGVNGSGDCFYNGYPVVFAAVDGVYLGYRYYRSRG